MKKKFPALFFALFCLTVFADSNQKKINQEVFSAVISEISRNHYDGNFRQKYAQTIDIYAEKTLKSVNNDELARHINSFFRQLPDSHFGISAPPTSRLQQVPLENNIRLLESGGKVFVSEVLPPSNFEKGDEILSVNSITPDKNSRIGSGVQFMNMLNFGVPQRRMNVEIIRHSKKMTITFAARRRQSSFKIFKIGEMPAMADDYESKLTDKNTAYIRFSVFTPHAVQSLKKDIRTKFKNVPKLVIDLRNNLGGLIMMGVNMASFLHEKKVPFGEMTIGGQKLTPESYPQRDRYRGKVFILIGRNSYSTAETFAQAMKEAKAAEIIGEKSSGMCLPSAFIALPHGFKLQTVVGDYRSAGGVRLEGVGVIPDKIIKLAPDKSTGFDTPVKYILQSVN